MIHMAMTQTITVQVSTEEKELIEYFSKIHGVTTSELLRQSAIEKIQHEMDIELYNKAMKAYEKDDTTYSVEEVDKILGL